MSKDSAYSGSGYFALNGITGMLIAVVLLLSIVGVLTTLGLLTQQSMADKPYVVAGEAVADPVSVGDSYKNLQELEFNVVPSAVKVK
ncbi:MAG: DUF4006 family protein [Helicobacteraceae bacterium]|jgi:hypothetical protein|nr:DUF4006 family protein [Helicobacteraceae bacterium]